MEKYFNLQIPKSEYMDRIKRLQNILHQNNLDLGLIYCTPAKPGDLMYFTGIDPNIFDAGAIVSKDKFLVLGGFETHEYSMDTMQAGEYRVVEGYDVVGDWPGVHFSKVEDIIKEASNNIKKVGLLTSKDIMPVGFYEEILEKIPNAEVQDASNIIADMRYIKSDNEQALIRASNHIATKGMRAMLDILKPGIRETEVAAEGDYTMKRMGARSYGFDTVVLSGERAKANIGRASNKIIRGGDVVVLGISSRFEGYACGLGRTLVAGGANKEQEEFLKNGVEALKLASGSVIYNQPAKYIDINPREFLKEKGLGKYQYYSVGHGSGIHECLEKEGADKFSDYLLPKNIIMQVDVGIFGHPIFFGARHEDPFLINSIGETERLTDLPAKVYY